MLPPLLHRINHNVLALLATVILTFPADAYSDTTIADDSSSYLLSLDESETNSHILNDLWLEQGMKEGSTYYENDDALFKLAKDVIKKYWATLLNDNDAPHSSDLSDHSSEVAHHSRTNLDIDLTSDTIKLGLAYSF